MKILPFTEDNFSEAITNNYTPKEIIIRKKHFLYFKEYLGDKGLKAKTIVIEKKYINKDFFEDYASYYAFCYENYPKYCKRVHFFSNDFTKEQYQKIIIESKNKHNEFWKHYLGFIVIKPIPFRVIGFSILKTYYQGQNFDERNFWGCRNYKIHLHGNEIDIISLAFQEQDNVLAACATTAIWSVLNKASADFYTVLKSPSEITKDAGNVSPDGSRLFPNKGLDLLQICRSILNSGLVTEVKQPDYTLYDTKFVSNQYLKKILNAYSPIGIPIILIIDVPNGNKYALHAITVSGYKKTVPKSIKSQKETSWLSDNIEKFYAHDDQWGSFARIEFKNIIELKTPWSEFHPKKLPTYTKSIIVPIYPKIRISYEDIESIVLGLDAILTLFFQNKTISDLVWDIRVDYSENYKNQIKTSSLSDSQKITILTDSLPKYLWISSCYIEKYKIFDFTFDATDVNSAMIGKDVVSYLPSSIVSQLHKFLQNKQTLLQPLLKSPSSSTYYEFLLKNI